MFKKNDFFIIGLIFVICLSLALFTFKSDVGNKIKITVNGQDYATYSLEQDAVYKIKTENGTNTLVINNGSAYFKDSNCNDKTCENMGAINALGQSIVCLPHRVVAEVVK